MGSGSQTIAIDHSKIDATLTDFPVAIDLDTHCPDLVSDLGTNKLKFKVKDSTPAECYVEIECWETGNHVIHAKIPSISSSADTNFTISWDSSWADNTTYVGETNSTPAENVWDSNFVAVYHMAQDPSGTAPQILDSTSNSHDGTSHGSMTSADLVNGALGKAIDFDGGDDYVQTNLALFSMPITVESVIFSTSLSSDGTIVGCSVNHSFQFRHNSAGELELLKDHVASIVAGSTVLSSVYQGVAVTYDGTNAELFLNGISDGTGSSSQSFDGGDILLGNSYNNEIFKGKISEVRLSSIARSDAWIKATHYSFKGNLLATKALSQSCLITQTVRQIFSPLLLGGV